MMESPLELRKNHSVQFEKYKELMPEIGHAYDVLPEEVFKDGKLDAKLRLSIGLPDFGVLPWEDVCKIRESRAGQDLRVMIYGITTEIKENLSEMHDEKDIELLVNKLFLKELVDQLMSYLPKAQMALLNLGSNLIPYGGGALVGGIKDLKDLVVKRNSWVSLLEIKPH